MVHRSFWIVISWRSLLLFLIVLYWYVIPIQILWNSRTNVLRCLDIESKLQFAIAGDLFDVYLLVGDVGTFNSNVNVHFILFTVIWNRLATYGFTEIFYVIQNGQKKKFFSRELERNVSDKFTLIEAIQDDFDTFWLGRWNWKDWVGSVHTLWLWSENTLHGLLLHLIISRLL